jgi:hypothetical protein
MGNEIIRLTTEQELEQIQTETFINNSGGLVNRVNDHSVIQGIIKGNAKIGKKALKDIALVAAHIFPDTATGTALDKVANDHGIAGRFGASQSSTFVRFIAAAGTVYQQGVHTVLDSKGNVFDLEDDLTIPAEGYGYVKVRSQESGGQTNAEAYTIVNVNPIPAGHIGVINEYRATGGRDEEQDDVFRQRIKEGPDILARGTLSYLTQAFIKINPNVLRVNFEGVSSTGKVTLSIMTQNGINLNQAELDQLLEEGGEYFNIRDLNPIGTQAYGVTLKNAEVFPIDISMRLELFSNSDLDDVAKQIQVKFSKYVDHRFWDSVKKKIEWDDLINIVKNIKKVKYVPDTYFSPQVDITVPVNKVPRFRSFQLYDLSGNILLNKIGTLSPVFYPNAVDASFTETVL